LAHEHFRLLVFVGESQNKLSFTTAASLQSLGNRVEYIKIAGSGPNALDFHIAYYIGRLAATDPTASFHIISKDTGFDPLVRHLQAKGILASRVKSVLDIPLLKVASPLAPAEPARAKSSIPPEERLEAARAQLQRLKASRPRTVKTLSSTIASLFHKQLSDEEVAGVIQDLASKGYIIINGNKITYELPSDG
jgi:hypothetical protein